MAVAGKLSSNSGERNEAISVLFFSLQLLGYKGSVQPSSTGIHSTIARLYICSILEGTRQSICLRGFLDFTAYFNML